MLRQKGQGGIDSSEACTVSWPQGNHRTAQNVWSKGIETHNKSVGALPVYSLKNGEVVTSALDSPFRAKSNLIII